ncbi:helix-turn-helix domain-containing protein [Picosynechococcus sp. PCC 8807]|uniref:helix-turn-helix domain-containing protein n=1 Tax=Picosynechococcus sp. PCC 8807 TaxID=195248 RepID=UPI00081052F2|nr:helix-turn-helix transcriptional regulator [Picosynechococcus sp. PCC 8807]ANV92024.1 hypothetical protein AWQ24_14690 [Picosynechococcus sp. PCC 8807]
MQESNRQQTYVDMGEILKKKNISQRWLAKEIGVSKSSLNDYIRKNSAPKLDPMQMWKLCRALDCSLEELVRDLYPVHLEN